MIAHLMAYSLVTAVFLGLAGMAAEAALRLYGRPARWVWLLALMGSIALPVSSLLAPGLRVESANPTLLESITGGAEATLFPPVLETLTTPRPWSAVVDLPLLMVWVATSIGLLIVLIWSSRRLARERTGWQHVRIGETRAWLSDDTGPAVVGLLRSSIVVPTWVLELEHDVQGLISLHEEEHLKAGDLRLMLAGFVFVMLAPWNLALWWQLRRLRVAVEADCDVRVLKQGADVLTYSSLLLEVGGRSTRHHVPALAFIKRTSALARRIHLMTWKPRMRLGRAMGAAVLAATLGALACETTVVSVSETETPRAQLLAEGADTSFVRVRILREGAPVEVFDPADWRRSDNEPLYIVDGVIVGRGAIDLATIESIEVVKGEAAQVLYGDRAANGVIIINTKDGEEQYETVELVRIKEKN